MLDFTNPLVVLILVLAVVLEVLIMVREYRYALRVLVGSTNHHIIQLRVRVVQLVTIQIRPVQYLVQRVVPGLFPPLRDPRSVPIVNLESIQIQPVLHNAPTAL